MGTFRPQRVYESPEKSCIPRRREVFAAPRKAPIYFAAWSGRLECLAGGASISQILLGIFHIVELSDNSRAKAHGLRSVRVAKTPSFRDLAARICPHRTFPDCRLYRILPIPSSGMTFVPPGGRTIILSRSGPPSFDDEPPGWHRRSVFQ